MIDRWTSQRKGQCSFWMRSTSWLPKVWSVSIVHIDMFLDNSWLPQFWPPLLEKLGKLHELYDQELGLIYFTLNSPEVRLIFDSVAHPWIIDEWQRKKHMIWTSSIVAVLAIQGRSLSFLSFSGSFVFDFGRQAKVAYKTNWKVWSLQRSHLASAWRTMARWFGKADLAWKGHQM